MEKSNFIEIDYDNWDRKEIYEEFRDVSYFVTIDVDVTHFVENYKGLIKFYPFMCYVASKVVNEHMEYRMARVDDKVGYFDVVHPYYTLLRPSKLFTHQFTRYSDNFADFYTRFLQDKKVGEQNKGMNIEGGRPKNILAISTMPHMSFKHMSFMYNLDNVTEYIPFTTFGKYYENKGRWLCPVSTQFYHEVNDGYHAERFYMLMQEVIDNFNFDVKELEQYK